jgi:hypothetical protein
VNSKKWLILPIHVKNPSYAYFGIMLILHTSNNSDKPFFNFDALPIDSKPVVSSHFSKQVIQFYKGFSVFRFPGIQDIVSEYLLVKEESLA